MIRRARVPAGYTEEKTLRGTVSFINTTASGAGAARVSRIDREHSHACQRSLVVDKAPQLKEGPVSKSRSLPLTSPYPVAYASEFFNGNGAPGAFSVSNDLLGNNMVNIGLIASLLTRNEFKFALGRAGALALQVAAPVSIDAAVLLNSSARVGIAVGVNRNVHDAHVQAQNISNVDRFRRLNVTGDKQIKNTINVAKATLAMLSLQKFALAVTAGKRNRLPSGKSPDGHLGMSQPVTQDACVIGNGSQRFEVPHVCTIDLIRIGNLGNAAHDYLGREWIGGAYVGIDEFVQRELAKGLCVIGSLRDVVASGVSRLKRLLQDGCLLFCGQKLELCSQFHRLIIPYCQYIDKRGPLR